MGTALQKRETAPASTQTNTQEGTFLPRSGRRHCVALAVAEEEIGSLKGGETFSFLSGGLLLLLLRKEGKTFDEEEEGEGRCLFQYCFHGRKEDITAETG